MNIAPCFSPYRLAGEWVFVSGQLPFDSDGRLVAGDVRAQTAQCLSNIRAILEPLGLTLSDVVKTTVWLQHASDFGDFNAAYAEMFSATPPARSTVRADLMLDARVEIEAIAFRAARFAAIDAAELV